MSDPVTEARRLLAIPANEMANWHISDLREALFNLLPHVERLTDPAAGDRAELVSWFKHCVENQIQHRRDEMIDDLVQQARDHAAVLSQLAHPLSEGMSDAKRLDAFVSAGNKAAALLTGLADEVARLREALAAMVDEQVDYMTINKLGDPEKQHNIKLACRALAGEQGDDHE